MNEKQARAEGLSSTGIYARSKDEVRKQIKQKRIERPKAHIVLVTIPDNPLSRGTIGVGYSAYADEYYQAYNTLDRAKPWIDGHLAHLQRLKEDYEKLVQEAIDNVGHWKEKAAAAEAILAKKSS